jgi:hypothetical protein
MSLSPLLPRPPASSLNFARSQRTRTVVGFAAFGLAAVFTIAGCSATSSDKTSSSSGSGDGAAVAPAAPPQDNGGTLDKGNGTQDKAGGTTTGDKADPQQAPEKLRSERSVVYTGTITVRVPNVDEAAIKASAAATGSGGFVGTEERNTASGSGSAKITLRIPAAKFGDVLATLHGLGKEESRALSTEDVTDQVADVDARLANAQASVDRVRALMARAQTIGEITSLESELSRREGDLESLKARKAKLDDLTTLSTITAVLLGPDAPAPKPQENETGFLAGLKSGWSAFLSSMQVLLTVLGALLPWIVILGVPVAVVLLWYRRRTRATRRRIVPAPATAETGTSSDA